MAQITKFWSWLCLLSYSYVQRRYCCVYFSDHYLMWLYMSRESLESFMPGYQHKMYLENLCVMKFIPCPLISLFLTLCLSVCRCVCVCLSLSSPLSCSLSHTSLYSFFSSYLYLLLYLPIAPNEYLILSLSTSLFPPLSISLFLFHPSLRLCLRLTTLTLSSLSISRVLSYEVFFLKHFHS